MNSSKKLTWQAYDHIRTEKGSDWYWTIGITAGAIVFLSLFFGNYILAVTVILGTIILFMSINTPPKVVTYEINQKGVVTGEILYTYSTLESYYVVDEDGFDRDRLLLKSKKTLMPLIVIPLGSEVTPEQIRDYLIQYLNEEELKEPTIHLILTRLGF